MMGQINEQAFIDAVHSKHSSDIIARDEAVKNCSVWQKKIEDPLWHPYKMITEDGSNVVSKAQANCLLAYISLDCFDLC